MATKDRLAFTSMGHNERQRRARNWTDTEMKALVHVWEEFVSELRESKRNAKIYEKMAKRFLELTGEHRHREEIKMKITNMSFQYRKMKCMAKSGAPSPEWPYFKAIDKILTQSSDPSEPHTCEVQPTVLTRARPEPKSALRSPSPSGFLPEYTGSSEEQDAPEEVGHSDSSASRPSPVSSSPQTPVRTKKVQQQALKRRKVRVLEAMLQEQKKIGRTLEEVCREVRRVMHQQNFLQVQSLQLQERMMNLLEKMIPGPTQCQPMASAAARESRANQA